MKPHKFKKFKQHADFRKTHVGLNLIDMYAVASVMAQRIAADPQRLEQFVTLMTDVLNDKAAQ